MGWRQWWNRLWNVEAESPLQEGWTAPPAPEATPQFISLHSAAERAAANFYETILYDFAVDHGLDPVDRVTNWFANLIASTVPVALMVGSEWQEMADPVGAGTAHFWITSGGTKYGSPSREAQAVAIREDRFSAFVNEYRGRVEGDETFYKRARQGPPSFQMQPPVSVTPNREQEFDWQAFDENFRRREAHRLFQEASERLRLVDQLIENFKKENRRSRPRKKAGNGHGETNGHGRARGRAKRGSR